MNYKQILLYSRDNNRLHLCGRFFKNFPVSCLEMKVKLYFCYKFLRCDLLWASFLEGRSQKNYFERFIVRESNLRNSCLGMTDQYSYLMSLHSLPWSSKQAMRTTINTHFLHITDELHKSAWRIPWLSISPKFLVIPNKKLTNKDLEPRSLINHHKLKLMTCTRGNW